MAKRDQLSVLGADELRNGLGVSEAQQQKQGRETHILVWVVHPELQQLQPGPETAAQAG